MTAGKPLEGLDCIKSRNFSPSFDFLLENGSLVKHREIGKTEET